MEDDLAAANVGRSYSLAATSIAIFTFVLFFLYPRYATGDVSALLFQGTLLVMSVATFSFASSSFYYYASSLGGRIDDAARVQSRRGDYFWVAQAGAVPISVLSLACELQRDWGRPHADQLRAIMREYFSKLRALKN
jgi:hypothetical protein